LTPFAGFRRILFQRREMPAITIASEYYEFLRPQRLSARSYFR
jgi:hypothetical protein